MDEAVSLAVIGAGYVGLVTAACFADWGHRVVCVDRDASKIAALKAGGIPIYEPGLEAIVERASTAGKLRFTTDLAEALDAAEAVFIGVGTPTLPGTNHADVSHVFAAVDAIAQTAKRDMVLVTKSTVPVGTAEQIRRRIAQSSPAVRLEVASNPEFLREGAAIMDFMKPDRVVVGAESPMARSIMQRIYEPLRQAGVPIVVTDSVSAELIKYAANAFLATKVTFINEMADVAERLGADIGQVGFGMGLDHRIGTAFLNPGPGFGGSCFPKDTRALAAIAQDAGAPSRIVDAVISANHNRMTRMIHRILEAAGGDVSGKTIAVLGLTFKANTDDMREAVSLTILPALMHAGAVIAAHDPAGMEQAKALLPEGVSYQPSAEAALRGADMAVILTEWQEYRQLTAEHFQQWMAVPLVVDVRNLYKPSVMKDAGVRYVSLGRPAV